VTDELPLQRPALTRALPSPEFLRWYWLKTELVVACRTLGVSPTGSKPELTARIAAALDGRDATRNAPRERRGEMPEQFTLRTRIGPGWRCNPALGQFLRRHAGRSFRFNAVVRTFVHTQVGATVADILACYRASVAPGATRPELPPQLEFNRHSQAFARAHPGSTRAAALSAWRARRARPSTET
jgi:SAP domain-containing new25